MVAGDRSLIAHLFRRAGFGARPSEITYYENAGYEAALEDLVTGTSIAGQSPSIPDTIEPINPTVQNLIGRVVPRTLPDVQSEWLGRMISTTKPLVERMTLFLHDHFATAYVPGDNIDTPELLAQNNLFRVHALGNWRTLVHAMIEDVALSCWLDHDRNVKQHPNENLARELMELFTLGPGNYTETDVREGARALTGYQLAYNLAPSGPRNHMVFTPARHDATSKTFLGRTGALMPHDVVDIILEQPAAPRFLARKLIETFVTETASSAFVERIAGILENRWELAPALRAIFLSPEFAASSARSTLVKSPAEFVAGALRALGRTESQNLTAGINWMRSAGQALFDPPNVGGWPRNDGWLGAGQVLARYNAASVLADRHAAAAAFPRQQKVRGTSIASWAAIFGMTDLAPETNAALERFAAEGASLAAAAKDHGMITLMVSSPDFSLA